MVNVNGWQSRGPPASQRSRKAPNRARAAGYRRITTARARRPPLRARGASLSASSFASFPIRKVPSKQGKKVGLPATDGVWETFERVNEPDGGGGTPHKSLLCNLCGGLPARRNQSFS